MARIVGLVVEPEKPAKEKEAEDIKAPVEPEKPKAEPKRGRPKKKN